MPFRCRGDDPSTKPGSGRVAPCEQRVTRGAAGRSTDIELGEVHSLPRHAVDVGRVNGRVAIMTEIPVAAVIQKEDNDIW